MKNLKRNMQKAGKVVLAFFLTVQLVELPFMWGHTDDNTVKAATTKKTSLNVGDKLYTGNKSVQWQKLVAGNRLVALNKITDAGSYNYMGTEVANYGDSPSTTLFSEGIRSTYVNYTSMAKTSDFSSTLIGGNSTFTMPQITGLEVNDKVWMDGAGSAAIGTDAANYSAGFIYQGSGSAYYNKRVSFKSYTSNDFTTCTLFDNYYGGLIKNEFIAPGGGTLDPVDGMTYGTVHQAGYAYYAALDTTALFGVYNDGIFNNMKGFEEVTLYSGPNCTGNSYSEPARHTTNGYEVYLKTADNGATAMTVNGVVQTDDEISICVSNPNNPNDPAGVGISPQNRVVINKGQSMLNPGDYMFYATVPSVKVSLKRASAYEGKWPSGTVPTFLNTLLASDQRYLHFGGNVTPAIEISPGPTSCPDTTVSADTAKSLAVLAVNDADLFAYLPGSKSITTSSAFGDFPNSDTNNTYYPMLNTEFLNVNLNSTATGVSADRTTYSIGAGDVNTANGVISLPVNVAANRDIDEVNNSFKINGSGSATNYYVSAMTSDGKYVRFGSHSNTTQTYAPSLDISSIATKSNGKIVPQEITLSLYQEAYGTDASLALISAPKTITIKITETLTPSSSNPTSATYGTPVTLSVASDNTSSTENIVFEKISGDATIATTSAGAVNASVKVTPTSGTGNVVVRAKKTSSGAYTDMTLSLNKRNVTLTPQSYTKTMGDTKVTYAFTASPTPLSGDSYTSAYTVNDGSYPFTDNKYMSLTANRALTMSEVSGSALTTFKSKYNVTFGTGTLTVKKDTPSASWLNVPAAKGKNGWDSDGVTVTLSQTAQNAGYIGFKTGSSAVIASVFYDVSTTAASNSFTFYKANGGYSEAMNLPRDIKIDKTAPESYDVVLRPLPESSSISLLSSMTGGYFFKGGVELKATVTDSQSGIDTISIAGKSGTTTTSGNSKTFTTVYNDAFKGTVTVNAKNNAGVSGTYTTNKFINETNAPADNLSITGSNITSYINASTVTGAKLPITVTAPNSGLKSVKYKAAGGTYTTLVSYTPSNADASLQTTAKSLNVPLTAMINAADPTQTTLSVVIQAETNSGNVLEKTLTVKYDVTPPVKGSQSVQNATTWVNTTKNLLYSFTESGSGLQGQTITNSAGKTYSPVPQAGSPNTLYAQDNYIRADVNDTYTIVLKDQAGNTTSFTQAVSKIDKVKPTTTRFASISDDTVWTNSNRTVEIKATDSDSGIKTVTVKRGDTSYSVNTNSESTAANYYGWFTADQNGVYTATITDNAGNVTTSTLTISKIDKSQPDVRAAGVDDANIWKNTDKRAEVSFLDGLSGIDTVSVKRGDTPYTVTTKAGSTASNTTIEFYADQNGVYTITATDKAGNSKTTTLTVSFIDKNKPVQTSMVVSDANTWKNTDKKVTLKATDTSGAETITAKRVGSSDTYEVKENSGHSATAMDVYFMADQNGTYQFEVSDQAGNTETFPVTVSKIDKVAPSISCTTPDQSTWVTSRVISCNITESDSGIYGEGITLNGAAVSTISPNGVMQATVTQNGTYKPYVVDNAGNRTEIDFEITHVDATVPLISNVTNLGNLDGDDWRYDRDVTFHVTSGVSKLNSIQASINGKAASPTQQSATQQADGTWDYVYKLNINENGPLILKATSNAMVSSGDQNYTSAKIDRDPIDIYYYSAPDYDTIVQKMTLYLNADYGASGLKSFKVYYRANEGDDYGPANDLRHVSGGRYTYLIDKNGTYKFVAENNAVGSTPVEFIENISNISNDQPQTIITATDEDGNAYDSGWINKDIHVKLENGTSGLGHTNVTYQVQVPGSDTWTTITSSHEDYVISAPSEGVINGIYKFRIITESGVEESVPAELKVRIDTEPFIDPEITDGEGIAPDADMWYGYYPTLYAGYEGKDYTARDDDFDQLGYARVRKKSASGWIDNWSEWSFDSIFTPDAEGQYEMQMKVEDVAGNTSAITSVYINVDLDVPDVRLTYKDNDAAEFLHELTNGLFFNKTITVKAEVDNEDAIESGIRSYQFQTKQGVNQDYVHADWSSGSLDNTYVIAPQFKGSVHAKVTTNAKLETASDEDEYISSVKSVSALMLETNDPIIRISESSTSWTTKNTIKVTLSDTNGSGISDENDTNYWVSTLDGRVQKHQLVSGENTLTLEDGEQVINIYAQDRAGNKAVGSITVKIHASAPSAAFTLDEANQDTWVKKRKIWFEDDAGISGLDTRVIKDPDDLDVEPLYTEDGRGYILADKNGTYTLRITNQAGASVSASYDVEHVDTTDVEILDVTNDGTKSEDAWKSGSRVVSFKVKSGASGLDGKPSITLNGVALGDDDITLTKLDDESSALVNTYRVSFVPTQNVDDLKIQASSVSGVKSAVYSGRVEKIDNTPVVVSEHGDAPDLDTIVQELKFHFDVSYGDSLLESFKVYYKGERDVDYGTTGVSLDAQSNTYYTYTAQARGSYKFVAVNHAGVESNVMEYAVNNISNDQPNTVVRASVDGEVYDGSWVNKDIHVALSNANSGVGHTDVTYQVQEPESLTWENISDPLDYVIDDSFVKGTYKFRIVTQSGVEELDTKSLAVRLDKVKNAPVITSVQDGWYAYNRDVSVELNAKSDRDDTFWERVEYSRDGTNWITGSVFTPGDDENGELGVKFRTVDAAGNISDEVSAVQKVDHVAPEVKMTYDEDGATSFLHTLTGGMFFNKTMRVKVNVENEADVVSGIQNVSYQTTAAGSDYDDANWNDISASREFVLTPGFDGDVHARVMSNAKLETAAVNGDTCTTVRVSLNAIKVESAAPTITFEEKSEDWVSNAELVFTIEDQGTSGTVSGLDLGNSYYTMNDAVHHTLQDGRNELTTLPDGDYEVNVKACDMAGNCADGSKAVKVDVTKPDVNITEPADQDSWVDKRIVNFMVSDATSGLDGNPIVTGPDGNVVTSTFADGAGSFEAVTNGTYTVSAKDHAGNTQSDTIVIAHVDASPVTIINVENDGSGEGDPWKSGSRTITFTVTSGASGLDGKPSITLDGTAVASDDISVSENLKESSAEQKVYDVSFAPTQNVSAMTIQATSVSGVTSAEYEGSVSKIDNTPVVITEGEVVDLSTVVAELTFHMDVSYGDSLLESFKVYYKGVGEDAYHAGGSDLTKVNDHSYTYTADTKGSYKFVAKNHAGVESDVKEYVVNNISNDQPDTLVTATTENDSAVYDGAWTNQPVHVVLSNTATGTGMVNVTYQVKKPESEDWEDISDEHDDYVIDGDLVQGVYQFRIISESGIVENTPGELHVRIDKAKPATPVIADAGDFEEDDWYAFEKKISAAFDEKRGRDDDLVETLQLRTRKKDNSSWIDNWSDWRDAASYTPTQSGSFEVEFRVIDNADNVSEKSSAYVNVDTTIPDVKLEYKENGSAEVLKALTGGLFFNKSISVHANVDNESDIISGIAGYQFQTQKSGTPADEDAWSTMSNADTFVVAPEFEGSIHAMVTTHAYKEAGTRVEAKASVDSIMLETSKPIITYSINTEDWQRSGAFVIHIAEGEADIESGLNLDQDTTYYTLDHTADKHALLNGDNALTLKEGESVVSTTLVDHAGNERTATQTLHVDTQNPVLTIDALVQDSYVVDREVNFHTSDATSGVKADTLTVSGPDGNDVNDVSYDGVDGSFNATQMGVYTITIEDEAGNSTSETIEIEKLDAVDVEISDVEDGSGAGEDWKQDEREITFTVHTGISGMNGLPQITVNGVDLGADDIRLDEEATDEHIYRYAFTAEYNTNYRIYAESNAGTSDTYTGRIEKIDKVTPLISVTSDNEDDHAAATAVFTLDVQDIGASGVSSVRVYHSDVTRDGEDVGEELERVNDTQYTYTANRNGTYRFVLYNMAGTASNDVTKTLTRISNVQPSTQIEATYRENGEDKTYDGSWIHSDIHVGMVNTKTGVNQDDATFEVSINGGAWEAVSDPDDYVISGDLNRDEYRFRAVSASGIVDESPSLLRVRIDKEELSLPIVPQGFERDDWYGFNKTITAKAGVAKDVHQRDEQFEEWLEYRVDDDMEWKRSSSYTIHENASHKISYRSHDSANNVSDEVVAYIQRDDTLPNVHVNYQKNGYSEWLNFLSGGVFFNDTVDVKIIVDNEADLAAGINSYEYRMQDESAGTKEWKNAVNGSFAIHPEFSGTIQTRVNTFARMENGTWRHSVSTTRRAVLETIAPVISHTWRTTSWSNEHEITLHIDDAQSGISTSPDKNWYAYGKNEKHNALKSGANTVTTLHDGSYDIYVQAEDIAGNTADMTIPVKIDTVKPIITLAALDQNDYVEKRIVSFKAQDALSGVKGRAIITGPDTNAALNWDGQNGVIAISRNGTYTIQVVDNAGNKEQKTFTVRNVLVHGNIENEDGSVVTPGDDGVIGNEDDVIIKPNEKGDKPVIREDGSVDIPAGGVIVLPTKPKSTSVVMDQGGTIRNDGSIYLPDGTYYDPLKKKDPTPSGNVVKKPDPKPADTTGTAQGSVSGSGSVKVLKDKDEIVSVTSKDARGFDADVSLVLRDMSDDDSTEVKNIKKKKENIIGIYDVSLMKGDSRVEPDGTLIIRVRLDELGAAYKDIRTYRVMKDGSMKVIKTRQEDDYLVYEADELGTVVFVNIKDEKTPFAGRHRDDYTWVVVVSVSLGGGLLFFIRRNRKQKKAVM